MSDQTLGERLTEKAATSGYMHSDGWILIRREDLASLIDTDEEVKRLAMMRDAYKLKAIELLGQVERLVADKERLDWILPRISGAEWRRIGVNYSGNCNREAIDAALGESQADKTKQNE